MPKYRKRPVVIEARRLTIDSVEEIKAWCGGKDWTYADPAFPPRDGRESVLGIIIETLEGKDFHVEFGDYVIQGVKGEFYSCKPDIFDLTYEAAE